MAIELSEQHSHFPNESTVICKIYPEKKSETLQQFTRKKLSFYFRYVRLAHLYINIKHSFKSLNEDVCRVFQRPFAFMNDPESKKIEHVSKQIILQVFSGGYRPNIYLTL